MLDGSSSSLPDGLISIQSDYFLFLFCFCFIHREQSVGRLLSYQILSSQSSSRLQWRLLTSPKIPPVFLFRSQNPKGESLVDALSTNPNNTHKPISTAGCKFHSFVLIGYCWVERWISGASMSSGPFTCRSTRNRPRGGGISGAPCWASCSWSTPCSSTGGSWSSCPSRVTAVPGTATSSSRGTSPRRSGTRSGRSCAITRCSRWCSPGIWIGRSRGSGRGPCCRPPRDN